MNVNLIKIEKLGKKQNWKNVFLFFEILVFYSKVPHNSLNHILWLITPFTLLWLIGFANYVTKYVKKFQKIFWKVKNFHFHDGTFEKFISNDYKSIETKVKNGGWVGKRVS